jgi:UDPglucose--hexose-1-phosphate uridylyltransferase
MKSFYKHQDLKADGRKLLRYGTQPQTLPLQPDPQTDPIASTSHLRWHPLRQEWVCYAAHRQDRTYKPTVDHCPFCPTHREGFPTEIPVQDFEVAVFENRFPAFRLGTQDCPELPLETAPGMGQCEVIVYSANHEDSLGSLAQSRLELIVQAWNDRYQELLAQEAIQFVMPFENRGEEVGVTLHHPHGQIYAFSYVPPVVEIMGKGFEKEPVLQNLKQNWDEKLTVFRDAWTTAFVPPFQRYPYELWLTTHRFHPGTWTFSDAELASLATCLGQVIQLYDRLFHKPLPYIMLLYAAPKGMENYFQFHIQFLPFLRTAEKLKYLAGCETGAGTFLADMLPEETAQQLRALIVG